MAYTNRTIRKEFPELGDDIWVAIRNPMLMPASYLQSDVDLELDENNRPKDLSKATESMMQIAAKLIVDWVVYDPFDDAENPAVIPLPATTETMQKVPMAITLWVSEIVGKALSPKN